MRPTRLLGFDVWILILPFLMLLPLIFFRTLIRLKSRESIILSRFDVYILILFFLFLITIIHAHFYNSINDLEFILFYTFSAFPMYVYSRLISWDNQNMQILTAILILLVSIYTILEFALYFSNPELVSIVEFYKIELQGVKQFNIPEHPYFFGEYIKPFGILMEASSSGVLTSILLISLLMFQLERPLNILVFAFLFFLGLIAIFLSGSKTSYFVTGVGLFFSLKHIKGLYKLYFFPILLGFIWTLSSFLLSENKFLKYYDSMVIIPITQLLELIQKNPLITILGIGHINNQTLEGVYSTEIDLINSIIRYGFIFIIIFFLMFYKIGRLHPNYFSLFVLVLISTIHYSVIFKFPVLVYLILFISMYTNSQKPFKIRSVIS